ncbi:MAG TPA: patatin-like phospholipase family protein [Acidimicrobiales bacterium]|nr:patatin-like phospholipase family protein [Acidimicrobiales bacterium]
MEQRRPPLRLSLTLPGGASLGAYQAGAVAALLVAVQELGRRGEAVVVDALGGASSGSLVALFAAQCLLEGLDPDAVLHQAWVERVTLDLLRGDGPGGPLTYDRLRDRIGEVLDPHDEYGRPVLRVEARHQAPLALHVSLTNLQGLSYPIRGVGGHDIAGTTYVDWSTFDLEPGAGAAQLLEPRGRAPLDHALASAANPGAFAPRVLNRSADEGAYRAHGISNFPSSGCLWYTDGGLLASEPVARTLAAARRVAGDGGGTRLHLVVDPRSEGPSGSSRWSDSSASPSWTSGIGRALAILPAQALYDDLRRVARNNARLQSIDEVASRLGPLLGGEALAVMAEVAGAHDASGDAAEVVRRMLLRLSGMEGHERVQAEVISPMLLAPDSGREVPGLLAGELFGTFGGFLSERMRESDYVLGWASTRAWLGGGLGRAGVGQPAVDYANDALDAVRSADWRSVNLGRKEPGDLSLGECRSLARFALRVGRVLAGEVLGSASDRRRRRQ